MKQITIYEIKNLFIRIFSLAFILSCNTEFSSINQAKNEVNKKGLREGRWVDFLSVDNGVLPDTTLGYDFYFLTEFDNGKIVGDIHVYDKYHGKLQILTPFLEEDFFEKNIDRDVKFRTRATLDSTGNICMMESFDKQMNLLRLEKYSTTEKEVKKNLKTLTNSYKKNTLFKTAYQLKNGDEVIDSKVIVYNESILTSTRNQELQEIIIARIDKEINNDDILKHFLASESNTFEIPTKLDTLYTTISKLNQPIKNKYFYVSSIINNSDTVNIAQVIRAEEAEYIERIRQKQILERERKIREYNARTESLWEEARAVLRGYNQNRRTESKTTNDGYAKTCGWCNRTFRGDHYTHIGRLADCYSTSSFNTVNKFCSMRCCSESRRGR